LIGDELEAIPPMGDESGLAENETRNDELQRIAEFQAGKKTGDFCWY
jgi:hypothetical protein